MSKNNCTHEGFLIILDPENPGEYVPAECGNCDKAGILFPKEKKFLLSGFLKANREYKNE